MSIRTTLVMVGVLAVLVVAWWLLPAPDYDAIEAPEDGESPVEAAQLLAAPLALDALEWIRIEAGAGESLAFRATGGHWAMASPRDVLADEAVLEQLVRTLSSLRSRQSFEPEREGSPSLAEAGLAPPRWRVTLGPEDGEAVTLAVGNTLPLSSDTYVRVGDAARVDVVGHDLAGLLRRPPLEYVERRVMPFELGHVQGATFAIGEERFVFRRGAAGGWRVAAPVEAPAAAGRVEELLAALADVRAVAFEAGDAGQALYGFAEPHARIQLDARAQDDGEAGETTWTLVIGAPADAQEATRYARVGSELIARVASEDVERLQPRLSELLERRVLPLRSEREIAALTITHAGETTRLRQTDDGWAGEGTPASIDQATAEQVAAAVVRLSASDFQMAPGEPPVQPLVALEVATADGEAYELTLTRAEGEQALVRVAGRELAYLLGVAQVRPLLVTPRDFRSRDLLRFDAADVRRVAIEHEGERVVLVRADDDWQAEAPAGAGVDVGAVAMLLNDLSALRAAAVVDEGHLVQYGLENPLVTVTLTGEELRHVVRLGLVDNVGYVKVDDDPFVYRLDTTVRDVLLMSFIEPAG